MAFVWNKPKTCIVCGKHFLGCRKAGRYCSEECRGKFNDHKYYLKNKKKCLTRSRNWENSHRDRVSELRKEKRKDPEKWKLIRAREIRYGSKPESKALARINVINRRARLKKIGGIISLKEWNFLKLIFNFTCPMCQEKEPKIKLTVDHIVPISKGGSGWIENIQPLCSICNKRKGTKIIKFSPVKIC